MLRSFTAMKAAHKRPMRKRIKPQSLEDRLFDTFAEKSNVVHGRQAKTNWILRAEDPRGPASQSAARGS